MDTSIMGLMRAMKRDADEIIAKGEELLHTCPHCESSWNEFDQIRVNGEIMKTKRGDFIVVREKRE